MKSQLEIPRNKRFLPWIAGIAVGVIVWVALLFVVDASGVLSMYVGGIVGFNAGAYVAAGIARPVEEEDDRLFLNPHQL
ncbi:MAG: hypothetical protein KY391_07135 [Actinobacteria bacterium]|nr:hypothetical protein [Actinomycetota bacterium]